MEIDEEDDEYIEKSKFLENFKEKMEIYDPLDRPIPDEDNVLSITTEELK